MSKGALLAALLAAALVPAGCSSSAEQAGGVPQRVQSPHRSLFTTPISHIVLIVQENRTVDNLFNGFPGADTVSSGKDLQGKTVVLRPVGLSAKYDISHKHKMWLEEYDDGQMNGFSNEGVNCYRPKRSECPRRYVAAYARVPLRFVKPYWAMAEQYTFADKMFQTNQGPSFPAHQYLVSGDSTIANGSNLRASGNSQNPLHIARQGGCDSFKRSFVDTINRNGKPGPKVFPCFDRQSIFTLLNQAGISWRYYQEYAGSGQWHAVDALKHVWEGPTYQNVLWPSSRILTDIQHHDLAAVTYVTPSALESDHAGRNNGSGPSWVASVVNALGQSSYWPNTAIIVVWDDWGGWYDHVVPTVRSSYELGFRVPMIVISPYAKQAYVSHVNYDFGSILRFVEETFDLPSLGTADARANDLTDCFEIGAKPRAFKKIAAPYDAAYFLRQPIDYTDVDDDF